MNLPCKLLPTEVCTGGERCTPTSCERVEAPLNTVLGPRPEHPAPDPYSVWRHRNGVQYVVLMVTNQSDRQDDYPATVVYMGTANHKLWSRRLSDWHRSMTFDHNWSRERIGDYVVAHLLPA